MRIFYLSLSSPTIIATGLLSVGHHMKHCIGENIDNPSTGTKWIKERYFALMLIGEMIEIARQIRDKSPM